MTPKPDSRTRTRTRNRSASACYRHRGQPSAGICAACLRERLSGVDAEASSLLSIPASLPSTGKPDGEGAGTSRNNGAADGGNGGDSSPSSSSFAPDLRRCRSVSGFKFEASAEPRRKSCDVGDRSSLALLFDINDRKNGPNAETKVESKNIGLSRLGHYAGDLINDAVLEEEIRVPDTTSQPPNAPAPAADPADDDDSMEGELKTMKEYIDLEIQTKNHKPKDLKDIAGNFWEAASVFSQKLRKWRQKQTTKKIQIKNQKTADSNTNNVLSNCKQKQKLENLRDSQSEIGENAMGRRSCDTEPRFSVEAGRLSMENPHIIIDEPRASWDGYYVARNIPRIAPRLSVGDESNSLSIDAQMHSIMEDESSSGGSGQSNSDSSYSQRESSFDRSSSVWSFDRKGDESKLVITEKELKDWHLKSVKAHCLANTEPVVVSVEPSKRSKNSSTTWRKVCTAFGFKQKPGNENYSFGDSEKPKREIITKATKELKSLRLTRSNSSVVRARNSIDKNEETIIPGRRSVSEGIGYSNSAARFLPERNKNALKFTSANLDNGVLPFYLMPLRTSKNKNSCISEHVLN